MFSYKIIYVFPILKMTAARNSFEIETTMCHKILCLLIISFMVKQKISEHS